MPRSGSSTSSAMTWIGSHSLLRTRWNSSARSARPIEFVGVTTHVVELIRADKIEQARDVERARTGPLSDRLEQLTNALVNKAESDMVSGIDAQPRPSGPPRQPSSLLPSAASFWRWGWATRSHGRSSAR